MTLEELTKLKVTKDEAIEIVSVEMIGVISSVGVLQNGNGLRGSTD